VRCPYGVFVGLQVLITLAGAGCVRNRGDSGPGVDRATVEERRSEVKGAEAVLEVESLMLHDIQGLYGGRALYIRPDGSAVVQDVRVGADDGLEDRRFEFHVPEAELDAFARALRETGFREREFPDRLGIPDEARAVLWVRFMDGEARGVGQWEGARHPAFSAVVAPLAELMDRAARGPAYATVPYDHAWRPDGVAWP